MADEFDGCECISTHELAMQRLINFIRQNQNACTDTECIDVSGRVLQPGQALTGSDSGNSFTIAMVFMLLAMFMYIVNPSTWRQLTNNKPSRRDNNPDGAPPPQPPAIN
ncbi:small integral membrane protein 14 [Drosophila hydei]|uniref:Small integral membrane protein 14 n=1 Tax=Drosophila hydei TaxID=7224 RepID=A0A6J1M8X6_DROHY|nr:small integral membrane protein 14 [Drosophila hydei]XP_023177747.2 small integral membrane protein 14 [Drosophila hydei]XP_023177748.2 small integral membrane protein 14 [Drosophila hydei]XP_023177749.2 small integral membrane protein 14 [Drosophila hydei]XP_023177750.2 small integral membrane protein 14 [Drosophila hydei]